MGGSHAMDMKKDRRERSSSGFRPAVFGGFRMTSPTAIPSHENSGPRMPLLADSDARLAPRSPLGHRRLPVAHPHLPSEGILLLCFSYSARTTCDSLSSWNRWEPLSNGADDMSDAKDPAIMLFGTTIPAAPAAPDGEEAEVEEADAETVVLPAEGQEDASKEVTNVDVNDISAAAPDEEDEGSPISSSSLTSSNEEDGKTSIADEKKAVKNTVEDTKTEVDCSGPEKVLKKPDKILPCPRCNSMGTKFCYYNNYNVNQPRHFCKNCQRYWTAGGTMRNVPFGAGRRKRKHLASQGHNLVTPSNGLQSAQLETLDLTHQRALPCVPATPSQPLIGNGTIHKFGQEVPLCEPMATVLNIRKQGGHADSGSTICQESREEPSRASSAAASNILENGSAENAIHKQQSGMHVYCNGLAPLTQLQCYPESSWSYPWRPAWSNVAAMEAGRCSSEYPCRPGNGYPNPIPSSPRAMMAATLPFFLMPTPFWGFTTWSNGTWNIPWVGSNSGFKSSSSSSSGSGCSGNDSPMLGKHSRGATLQSEEKMEKSIWVPKTLRIDDPEEAAKSSIWAALGIRPGIGGVFQSKAENKAHKSDAAHVLHANPAALSRSLSFQENT